LPFAGQILAESQKFRSWHTFPLLVANKLAILHAMNARNIERIHLMSPGAKAEKAEHAVYRRVRFPGITRFASAYGYNYVSVYRHLTGERPSKTIGRKWEAWQAGRAS
jgi:hypothetical protein